MVAKTKRTKAKIPPKEDTKGQYNLRSARDKPQLSHPNKRLTKALSNKQVKTKLIKKATKIKKVILEKVKLKINSSKLQKRSSGNPIKNKRLKAKRLLKNISLKSISKNRVRKTIDNSFISIMLASSRLKCQRKNQKIYTLKKKIESKNVVKLIDSKNKSKLKQRLKSISKSKSKLQINSKEQKQAPYQPLKTRATKQIQRQTARRSESPAVNKQLGQNIKRKKKDLKKLQILNTSKVVSNIDLKKQIPWRTTLTISQMEEQKKRQKQVNRFFLISVIKSKDKWIFKIANGGKNLQTILLSPSIVQCSCINYRLQRAMCGEMEFVFQTILHNEEFKHRLIQHKCQINEGIFDKMDQQICQILSFYLDQKHSNIPSELQEKCLICFNNLDGKYSSIEKCEHCSLQFHSNCLRVAFNHSFKCPQCKTCTVEIKQEITETIQKQEQCLV